MDFADFLPHVLPSATGCPDSLAEDHIKKAARLFCARTLVWNYECVPIDSVAGITDYTLQIGEGQELVRVLLCEVDGTEYEIPSGVRGRQMARNQGSNLCVMKNAHDFTLVPAPQLDGLQIITDIAVKPAMASTAWPDDFEEHVTDIVHGAVATLCALPGTTWRDMETADRQQAIFNQRIATVAAKVAKGLGRSRRPAAVQWF